MPKNTDKVPIIKSARSVQLDEESLPAVSFDVKLGKKYKWVDFDYDAYRKMIEDMGGNDEDFRDASVRIRPEKLLTAGRYFSFGFNDSDEGTIEVCGRPKGANKTLAHESRHFLDDLYEELSVAPAVADSLSPIATAGGLLTGVGGWAAYGAGNLGLAERIAEYGILPASIGAIALLGIYSLSEQERAARKASREHGHHSAITFVHK